VVGFDTLAGEIHALARALDLGAHVEFAGLVPHSRLRPEYENADLLVMTSRHEAGPLVMLEAALCGVPTIGTRVGHIADQAPHAALAVPIRDPAALADAIDMLASDEEHRLRLAWAAQAFAVQNDAASTAHAFETIYRGVANG
jgi:glycosyltransferase involved in cell wall biosynthesis